jgi:hypothetical protein
LAALFEAGRAGKGRLAGPGKDGPAMADERAKRIAELIKPLRVKLAMDFDPGHKAGFLKKKDGTENARCLPARGQIGIFNRSH